MDYCTGFFEGWWADCCAVHDLAYLNQVPKLLADQELAQCVVASASSPVQSVLGYGVAGVMFLGVSLFGRHFYNKAKQNKDLL